MTIYRSAIINRKAGLTEAQFRQHWIDVHGMHAAKMPGVGTYRQNHVVERFLEDLKAPLQSIDGFSQLSFESIAAMEVSDASPEYAVVKADIPNFQGGITILVLKSEEVLPVQRPPEWTLAKLMWVSTRRADALEGQALRTEWLQQDQADASTIPGLKGYVQNFVIDKGHPVSGAGVPTGDAGPVDVVGEAWFDDLAALNSALAGDRLKKVIFNDPYLVPMAVYLIDEIRII